LINEGERDPSNIPLPNYCRKCGEPFPWVSTYKENVARDTDFITAGAELTENEFYTDLISEINRCYKIKADEATLILYRKLLENLLIDIIRSHYGIDEIELYFDTDKGRHRYFSELIDNLRERAGEFHKYSTALDDNFIDLIEDFKYRGDASAHSIENRVKSETIRNARDDATYLVRTLIEMRRNIRTVHRTGDSESG
jgi:hypothetical protein